MRRFRSKPSRSPAFEPRLTCSRSKSPTCKPNWKCFRDEASSPSLLEIILLANPTNGAVKEPPYAHDPQRSCDNPEKVKPLAAGYRLCVLPVNGLCTAFATAIIPQAN